MSINLIVACCKTKDNKLGIGYRGKMPWFLQKDLIYFQKLTKNNIVVMGRKTYESIGKCLPNRVNIILSKSLDIKDIHIKENSELIIVRNPNKLDEFIENYLDNNRKIFIIGGNYLYKRYISFANNILLTHIEKVFECDTYFPDIPVNFELTEYSSAIFEIGIKYRHLIYTPSKINNKNVDEVYHSLLYKILDFGNNRPDRTNTGTVSLFGEQIKIDISKYAPVLTTKKVAWKSAIIELLFFLSGETDTNILREQGVHIWDGNTSREFLDNRGLHDLPEFSIGSGYPWQIRRSGAKFPDKTGGIDQLLYIENLLKTDPFSRRIMWNLWIPSDLDKMPLPPCHIGLQLYVEKKNDNKLHLSGIVNMRSNDLFLGNPFNIVFYYTLICILAIRTDMVPNELIFNIGDAHIYHNHLSQVKEQLSRSYKVRPILEINSEIKYLAWEDIKINHFDIVGYTHHDPIKAKMAV